MNDHRQGRGQRVRRTAAAVGGGTGVQAEQLNRLADGQERVQQTLAELVRLMTEPDEKAGKLHVVLASLIKVIAVNTATLQTLQRSLTGRSDQEPDEPH